MIKHLSLRTPQEFSLDSGYVRSGSVLSMEADLEQGRLEGEWC